MKSLYKPLFLLLLTLCTLGCTPHPGSGRWQAMDGSPGSFRALTVEFDGKASLQPTDDSAEAQRCFWSARDPDNLELQCTQGDDTGLEFTYLLTVNQQAGKTQAVLTEGDRQLGVFEQAKP